MTDVTRRAVSRSHAGAWERENAEIERKYRAWENSYHQAADTFSTCAFIGSFGNQNIHPEIVPILEIHDEMSCKEGASLA